MKKPSPLGRAAIFLSNIRVYKAILYANEPRAMIGYLNVLQRAAP